ncbi:DUF3108 domain-containing protein [Pseudohongiella sp.]|uniref:DUF3108 domain-containing protein n=1 Tax=marine sediment metagenome TaxID=412755 RepID=A0A0F9Z395_9ZZZZ|nr:DUF3108 domain-containing protein [Pseudohongiella sp.]HDZ09138.1 DUF3108 domain-containing protein [Pseudohongiella sp.]HEA63526.1 DUF3108 domain-containing protein [Pseudohongiella sp.]
MTQLRNTIRSLAMVALTVTALTPAAPLYGNADEEAAALIAPTPYEARYEARARGLSTDAYRNLVQTDTNVYQLGHGLSLRVLGANLITVTETSHFYWIDSGAVPVSYSYEQSGLRRRQEQISFDWEQQRASVVRNDRETDTAIYPGLLDNLSFTAQMSSQLNANADLLDVGTTLEYQILDGTEPETQVYRVAARETVETLAGALDTVLVERVREPDSDRSTRIWLAIDHEFVLAKLEQVEDGDTTELLLSAMTMGDVSLSQSE